MLRGKPHVFKMKDFFKKCLFFKVGLLWPEIMYLSKNLYLELLCDCLETSTKFFLNILLQNLIGLRMGHFEICILKLI